METNPKVTIIYRMAEQKNKNNKAKPSWISNELCLKNAAKYRKNATLIVFGDNLLESTKEMVSNIADAFFETERHGNSQTFLEILEYVTENFDTNEIVYFLEDDYIHRENYIDIILEGLQRADYVSLYDHPDKYEYESEASLFYTKSSHWKLTSSTTMTFATKVNTLLFDYMTWKNMTEGTKTPPDYYIWNYLTQKKGRKLATPLPGYATHGEIGWLAPVINWENI
jgi:hypothetical protein